ncbi:MAG: gliding motility protein GldN, partial [Gillisia sp.]
MKWNQFLIGVFGLLFGLSSFAQTNMLNAKSPDDIGKLSDAEMVVKKESKPLEYGYVDERDILWSKNTWEIIDLDERVNFPLYYP